MSTTYSATGFAQTALGDSGFSPAVAGEKAR
jgi:hypothetical protein